MTTSMWKGHAVCIPLPAQGHITPMLHLAKLLHRNGFYITFVNTHYNHRRLLHSTGPSALDGLPDFRFAAIPDGLPPSNANTTQDIPSLCYSISTTCFQPLCDLLSTLNQQEPPVTCIVSDGAIGFGLDAAHKFGLPEVMLWTSSTCSLLAFLQYPTLIEKGYTPLKDEKQLTNGYLETIVDWIPGMKDDIKLRDLPSFLRTTDPKDIMLNHALQVVDILHRSRVVVFNTFDSLDHDALNALSTTLSARIYAIGPLQLMLDQVDDDRLSRIKSSLWKEDLECIKWLDKQEAKSVVYVNFGSITVMNSQQLTEFSWGLANSKKPFLWVIRPDLIMGESAMVPEEVVAETKDRSMIVSWCPQKEVLQHAAVGGFLTHGGWNSMLETIVGGVPVLCWPFFGDQQTNCRYSCVEWGIGKEIDNNVKRDEVELLVKEMMDERGGDMKGKVMEWKRKAEEATAPGGSSNTNLDKVMQELLLH